MENLSWFVLAGTLTLWSFDTYSLEERPLVIEATAPTIFLFSKTIVWYNQALRRVVSLMVSVRSGFKFLFRAVFKNIPNTASQQFLLLKYIPRRCNKGIVRASLLLLRTSILYCLLVKN